MKPDREQQEAIQHPPGALRIVAGPGAGKTYVLTERIRHFVERLSVPPHRVLAVTFTVKAAHEMRRRLAATMEFAAAALTIKTLHAFGFQVIRRSPRAAGAPDPFELLVRRSQLLRHAEAVFDELGALAASWHMFPEDALVKMALRKGAEPERALQREADSGDAVAAFQLAFDRRLRAQGLLTFDDLPLLALRACREDPPTLSSLRRHYDAIFVDEFQDVNETQRQLVELIADRPGASLTVVGDDDQSIYGWRGASPEILRSFDDRFRGASTCQLGTNYRSSQVIVEASTAVIDENTQRIPKDLRASRSGGSSIRVAYFASVHDEASSVAEEIEDLISVRGVPASDVAVLSRNNDLIQFVRPQLLERKIPVTGDDPLQTSQAQGLLSLVRTVLEGPGDWYFARALNVGRRRVLRSELRQIAGDAAMSPGQLEGRLADWLASDAPAQMDKARRDELSRFAKIVAETRHRMTESSPADVLDHLFARLGIPTAAPDDAPGPTADLSAAAALVRAVAEHRGSVPGAEALAEVLMDLEQMRSLGEGLDSGVHLLTVHRAKGLEFEFVYLLGVQDDRFPNMHFAAAQPALMEEERRLFYVAMTRAKTHLRVSGHGALPGIRLATGEELPDFSTLVREVPPSLREDVVS